MANEASEPNWRFIARLRLAGFLVVIGLMIQVVTLFVAHPFSFLSFLLVGTGFVAVGVVAFLWAWAMQ